MRSSNKVTRVDRYHITAFGGFLLCMTMPLSDQDELIPFVNSFAARPSQFVRTGTAYRGELRIVVAVHAVGLNTSPRETVERVTRREQKKSEKMPSLLSET